MRVEASIDIARSPDEVWAVVADPEQDVRWCPKVRGVTPAGPHRWEVTHAPVPLRPAKTLVLQQVLAEAPRRLVLRQEDDVSVFDVEYTLAPVPDGATRFTQRSNFAWKTLPRVLRPIFAKGVERDVTRQLAKLKALLEDGPPRVSDVRGRWLAAWGGGAVIGVANGIAREATFAKVLSEREAHAASGATAVAAFAAYFAALERRWPLPSAREALVVGSWWLGLTVAFEFGFGRAVAKLSWEELLADYDVTEGRTWPFVLAWIATGPAVVRAAHRR